MSEQEKFDWDDDMDFESLADEQEMQEDSLEELADFGEESQVDPPEIDVNVEAESGKDHNPGLSSASGLGLSAGGVGTLFAISTLVSGLGLAGAVLFVGNLDPMAFWNPEGLTQVNQWFNFQTYPLNLLYILVAGVLALSILGSWAVARSVKAAQAQHEATADLLEKITQLRLDHEEPWQNSNFKADSRVAGFVAETLGSWRLQMARQQKSIGLEGELRRLQKALEAKSRDDLVGRYDNPFAGDLADAAVQLFDAGEAARKEAEGTRSKDQHHSEEILSIVQDARSWNRSTRERMGFQGVAVEKLSTQLAQLGSLVSQLTGSQDQSQVSAAVADISREVAALNSDSAGGVGLVKMGELVDRGSKLAFQIAMEVARLGTRGERLLPMTQALEELTNEFRQTTTALGEDNGSEAQGRIKERLEQVQARLDKGAGPESGKLTEVIGQLIPSAEKVSQDLGEVSQTFTQQADRLTKLGETLSTFTGVTFDAEDISAGNPDNPPEGGLNLTQHDPFASTVEPEDSVADVDPFSHSDDLLLGSSSQPEDSGFLTSVTPGQEESYGEAEPLLPPEEEKVYDLAEFEAVRLDEPETADAEGGEVYDLAEFGAVSLT
jgi:hypothetical protein